MRIARAEVSPIVPWILPRNRFFTGIEVPSMNPWFLSAVRGVACVTAVYNSIGSFWKRKVSHFSGKRDHKETSSCKSGHKFCPSPPNSCFTTMIAKALPRIGIQIGIWAGMFSASRSPVTTALKSVVVFFLCISRSYSHSKKHTGCNRRQHYKECMHSKVPNTEKCCRQKCDHYQLHNTAGGHFIPDMGIR